MYLTHMCRSIGAYQKSACSHGSSPELTHEREDGSELADQDRQSHTRPAARVGELGKNLIRGCRRTHNPERNQDGKKPKDVNDQDQALERGEIVCTEGIDQGADAGNGDGQECAMPSLELIHVSGGWIGVVDDEEALDEGAAEETDTGKRGLPA